MQRLTVPVFSLFLLLGFRVDAEIQTLPRPFISINPTFPTNLLQCMIAHHALVPEVKPKLACAKLCLQSPSCNLYCIKGSECSIFSAWAADYWAGVNGSPHGFTSCYSSWYFLPNLTPLATATSHSVPFVGFGAGMALKGYHCTRELTCSITDIVSNPWWMADLQQTRTISYIVVKTREDGNDFTDVQVKLGNSPTFQNNPEFAMHNGPPPPVGTSLTLTPSAPMQGRYLSFQSLVSSGALSLCVVNIVGE